MLYDFVLSKFVFICDLMKGIGIESYSVNYKSYKEVLLELHKCPH